MRQSWFSAEGDEVLLGRYVERVETWREAIADGHVSDAEVNEQAERVAGLMRELEETLDDDEHERVTTVFVEWAVLQGLQSQALLQDEQSRSSASSDDSGATS